MTVLAIAEHRDGVLREVSFELVTAGTRLAHDTGTDFAVAILGGNPDAFADELDREGVETIYTVDVAKSYNHGVYTQAIDQLFADVDPEILLMPHTVNGMDYAPAVASRLDLPLATDAIDMEVADAGITVTRERYGGKVASTYAIAEGPVALTLRPAAWPATDAASGDATIESVDVSIDHDAIGVEVLGYDEIEGGDVDIAQADVLVSIGRGIEDEENLPLVEALADTLDAVVSGSRPIVDNGWLPRDRQVGQSGKTVTPDVYLAIGISGAVQHVSGMKGSDIIIAINTDPDAPIFDIADCGIVGDLFDVVPELIEVFGGEPPR